MKSLFKVMLVSLIAVSAFAISVDGLNQTQNQIMIKGMNQSASQAALVTEPGMTRDLRNGNFALACQTEDYTYLAGMLNYIYFPVISVPAGTSVRLISRG